MELLKGIYGQWKRVIRRLSQRAGVWWAPLNFLYGLVGLIILNRFYGFFGVDLDNLTVRPLVSPISTIVSLGLIGAFGVLWIVSSLCLTYGFMDTFFQIWKWDRERPEEERKRGLLG